MTRTFDQASKVPEVTLVFWIIKIAATTLGETGGDTVTMTLGWGYLAGTALFLTLLVTLIAIQIAADAFHPWLYWATIVASTTAGTTLADFADRSLGIGYAGGSALLFVGLIAVLGAWYWSLGSISVATVSTPKVEAFHWAAITLSQTLGTALGDWTADDTGLGYEGGALLFAAGLAVLALAYYLTSVSRVFLFWAAFILSRPLGATVGDFLDKPVDDGGVALSRPLASAAIGAFTSNKIIRAFLTSKGVKDEDIMEKYTPFGFADWQTEVAAIKKFGSSGKKTAVISTINGDANVPFYKELANQGIKASDIPVIAFSVGEEELAGVDTKPLVGHLAAWSYFESVSTPENKVFIAKWHDYMHDNKRVTNDPMESAYILFHMWVQAVQQAGTTDVDAVRQAMIGQRVKSPSGFDVVMGANHHMAKPVMIGEIQANGQFAIVYKSKALPPRAWSPYVEANKGKVADWSWPWACGGCSAPKYSTF
jgi:uncharacterized membrane-anchored protein